jgi:hypothetical protein
MAYLDRIHSPQLGTYAPVNTVVYFRFVYDAEEMLPSAPESSAGGRLIENKARVGSCPTGSKHVRRTQRDGIPELLKNCLQHE